MAYILDIITMKKITENTANLIGYKGIQIPLQLITVFMMLLIAHDYVGLWVSLHKTIFILTCGFYGTVLSLYKYYQCKKQIQHWFVGLISLSGFYIAIIMFSRNSFLMGLGILFYIVGNFVLIGEQNGKHKAPFRCMTTLVIITSVIYLFADSNMGLLWHVIDYMAIKMSSVMNSRIIFGPTASMIKITLYSYILAVAIYITSSKRYTFSYVVFGVIALLLNVLYIRFSYLMPPKSWEIGIGESEYEFGDFQIYNSIINFFSMFDLAFVYGLLLSVLCGFWLFRLSQRMEAKSSSDVSWKQLFIFNFGIASLLILAFLHTSFVTFSNWKSPKIGWLSTWDESYPAYKNDSYYGIAGTGMYGIFLDDIRKHGVEIVDLVPDEKKKTAFLGPADPNIENNAVNNKIEKKEQKESVQSLTSISYDNLKNLDMLIVMVRTERFSVEELESLTKYLNDGGQVLIVGDHTNMEGCQIPFNQLTVPYNIKIEFDSGFSFISWWFFNIRQSMHLPYVAHNPTEYGVSTGGSLTIKGLARPLLVGKYAFSDLGNIFKGSRKEAFLGDYTYQHGERLSDIVLAAEAKIGKGRIVAFGDSSSFQNIAYAGSARFVRHLIGWMLGTNKRTYLGNHGHILIAILMMMILSIIFWENRLWHKLVICLCVISILLAVWCHARGDELSNNHTKRCLLLRTNLNKINKDKFVKGSFLGLPLNLNRSGYSTEWSDTLDAKSINGVDILFLMAPTKPISNYQQKILDDYMKSGGHLVITAGYEIKDVIKDFTEKCGLRISDNPLGGDVFKNLDNITPMFVDSWEIQLESPNTHVLYKRLGRPVIAFSRIGKGGLLFIGDSLFFRDANLEEEKDFRLPNINFLRTLLSNLSQGKYNEITNDMLKKQLYTPHFEDKTSE